VAVFIVTLFVLSRPQLQATITAYSNSRPWRQCCCLPPYATATVNSNTSAHVEWPCTDRSQQQQHGGGVVRRPAGSLGWWMDGNGHSVLTILGWSTGRGWRRCICMVSG